MIFFILTSKKVIRIKLRWLINWLRYPFFSHKISLNKNRNILSYQKSRQSGPESIICHAPSRSIYFGFGGLVVPCCFNREHTYGIFPFSSVDDIINSPQKKKLSTKLHIQDFSSGCEHCLSLINSNNFDGVEARLYDGLKVSKNKFPSEMIFELENTCNLECVMCNETFSSSIQRNKEKTLSSKSVYDETFITQITPYIKHLEVAKFIGGEPFLIKIYYQIWEKIIELNPNCIINVQTNGTIFNQRISSLLKKGRFQIGISIDSLKKDIFENLRKNSNFEMVINNLNQFIILTNHKGGFVNISVCPMIQNWREIPDLVNFCNNKNIFIYFNTVYTEGYNLRELNSEKLNQIIHYFENTKIPQHKYISYRNSNSFNSLIKQIKHWHSIILQEEEKLKNKHHYNKTQFITLLTNKITNTNIINRVENILNEIPQEIYLNDVQLNHLNSIDNDIFTQTLMDHNDEFILQLLNNFIKKNNFLFQQN